MIIAYNENLFQFSKYGVSASVDDLTTLEAMTNSLRDLKLQKERQLKESESDLSKKQDICTSATTLLNHENRQNAQLRRKLNSLKPSVEKALKLGEVKYLFYYFRYD